MRCIACGNAVGDPPQLNDLPDGTPCRACRNRALEAVPAALPRTPDTVEEPGEAGGYGERDAYSAYDGGDDDGDLAG